MTTSEVVVVGAGLAGSLLANLLARRGRQVDVYDLRPDPRSADTSDDGRSINLGMSRRALAALDRVGLRDAALRRSVPMTGRVVHQIDGSLRSQPYGATQSEKLHAIRRRDLNAMLVEAAAAQPGVRFHFGSRLVDLEHAKTATRARFVGGAGSAVAEVHAALVIGADGVFSTVRRCMQRGEPGRYHQDVLEWGHKELTIPAAPDGSPQISLNALHVWPRSDAMIVAHPNLDGSFTATLFLAHNGPAGFAALDTPRQVQEFFAARFAEVASLIPDVAEQFLSRPVGELVTIRTSPWHHRDRIVLIGDAAHAVYPFYGQGMNAALEDCVLLDGHLARGDTGSALAGFERDRKRHTDVLADLSERNFIEFRDGMRSPWRLARWQADLVLNRLAPRGWRPLYSMVSHSTMPYADALRRARLQNALLAVSGAALLGGAALAVRRMTVR